MLSCIQPLPTLHFLCIIREHLACDCLPRCLSPSCIAEATQRPKKTLISRSGQWLCEEKSSKVDSLYKDRLLHDDVHRGVTDFCHWAEDLDKLFINRPPSLREHCGHWSEPRSSGRAGELLAGLRGTAAFKDFILSRGYRMPRFLEKIYAEEKNKSENIKAPKKLTQTEKNPGSR
ncbi:protein FAM47E isoform 8 [Mus musculus]|uniref:protein FAM47E isoform 8 n=1 Tax=Mus musculus TaxID=10090 RepID=UPI0011AE71E2|nr:protein FAM47E isoform 8 [Mus musculus]